MRGLVGSTRAEERRILVMVARTSARGARAHALPTRSRCSRNQFRLAMNFAGAQQALQIGEGGPQLRRGARGLLAA